MPAINRRFPHLLPADIDVWLRFLALHDADYTHIDYDVRVGKGRDPGENYNPRLRQMGLDLSRRRIDAIGHTPDRIDIIEITTDAGMTAIGQLIAYMTLYPLSYPITQPLRPLLVARSLKSDIQPALIATNISWQLV